MDKSIAVKYLNDIHTDLDAVGSDFHFALQALERHGFKDSDLVVKARATSQRLSVMIDELSELIVKHDEEAG